MNKEEIMEGNFYAYSLGNVLKVSAIIPRFLMGVDIFIVEYETIVIKDATSLVHNYYEYLPDNQMQLRGFMYWAERKLDQKEAERYYESTNTTKE